MAHIHLEDGSFPLVWVIIWWIAALLVLGISLYAVRRQGRPKGKVITIAAFCTAASFAVFQISIPVFGGVHLNFTPLIGILTGPAVGSLVVLLINILSCAIGHGGWGMIGANTLVNMVEVTTAYLTYRGIRTLIAGEFTRAGLATLAALVSGNLALVGLILISGIQGVTQGTEHLMYGLSLLAVINLGAAFIEAVITGFMVGYMEQVRPDLIGEKKYPPS